MSAAHSIVVGVGPLGYVFGDEDAEEAGADGMHPEEIKAALRMKGITLAALAEQCGVSRSMVTHVIHGYARSAHIQQRIAGIIGKSVDAIWKNKPVLRRKIAAIGAVA